MIWRYGAHKHELHYLLHVKFNNGMIFVKILTALAGLPHILKIYQAGLIFNIILTSTYAISNLQPELSQTS